MPNNNIIIKSKGVMNLPIFISDMLMLKKSIRRSASSNLEQWYGNNDSLKVGKFFALTDLLIEQFSRWILSIGMITSKWPLLMCVQASFLHWGSFSKNIFYTNQSLLKRAGYEQGDLPHW